MNYQLLSCPPCLGSEHNDQNQTHTSIRVIKLTSGGRTRRGGAAVIREGKRCSSEGGMVRVCSSGGAQAGMVREIGEARKRRGTE